METMEHMSMRNYGQAERVRQLIQQANFTLLYGVAMAVLEQVPQPIAQAEPQFMVARVVMVVESHLGLMEPPPLVVGVEETTT
jgi:hypothetical protein